MDFNLNHTNDGIEQANQDIELGECLKRLLENKDFKTAILDRYLKDDTLSEGLSFSVVPEKNRTMLLERLAARGHLYNWINKIIQYSMEAKKFKAEEEERIMEALRGDN